jgi:perosamine synthetase
MAEKLALSGGPKTVPAGLEKEWPPITQDDIDAVVRVLKRGILWGPTEEEVQNLQKEFARYIRAKHCLVVNSGTAALHAGVVACGVGPGDEVITSAFSFWATSQAVLAANGIPVFVDIEPETMNMDPDAIEKKITKRTKALFPVHVHGLPADMDPINRIAKKHKLFVIEDAAQAAGAKYKGKFAGTLGDIAGFSLNGSKNLPAGEGGFVTTNDSKLFERARMMSMFGEKAVPKGQIRVYDAQIMGFNYRNNEMSDAFVRSFLKRYDHLQDLRKKNVYFLNEELGKMKGVKVPTEPKGFVSSWHLYRIRLYPEQMGVSGVHPKRFRLAFQKCLFEEGVNVREWHSFPVSGQKIFLEKEAYGRGCPWSCGHASEEARKMVYDPMDYPKTLDMFDRSFTIIPFYPPNDMKLMELIVKGFRKVHDHLDEVVKLARKLKVPKDHGEKRDI